MLRWPMPYEQSLDARPPPSQIPRGRAPRPTFSIWSPGTETDTRPSDPRWVTLERRLRLTKSGARNHLQAPDLNQRPKPQQVAPTV